MDIYLFTGKSASGKDYLSKSLIEFLKDDYDYVTPIVSVTTRPMRDGETEGVEYHFISDDEFDVLKLTDSLIESREYNTEFGLYRYGTPRFSGSKNEAFVGIVDISGAEEIVKAYPKDYIEVRYIYAPDNIREERARERGSFDKNEWDRRLREDEKDFAPSRIIELADLLDEYENPPLIQMDNY